MCEQFGAEYSPPEAKSKLGVALETLRKKPINGLRHKPSEDTSGWYIWGGENCSKSPDFFSPLHVSHMSERCPIAERFLALPPGYRFLTDGKYVDVWFDPTLLEV